MLTPKPLSVKSKDYSDSDLPVVLSRIIDAVNRQRHDVEAQHGLDGVEQLKKVTRILSELHRQMVKNEQFLPLTGSRADVEAWNRCLEEYKAAEHSDDFAWFKCSYLMMGCCFYRRLADAFDSSRILRSFDPFQFQKQVCFINAIPVMESTAAYLKRWKDEYKKNGQCLGGETVFNAFLQISLWGNKFDLSMTTDEILHELKSPLDHVQELHPYILQDDSKKLYETLKVKQTKSENKKRRLDVVLDNAGMELFGDFCLVEYLLTANLVDFVVFHVKSIPWFHSDTMRQDFTWTLEMLRSSNDPILKDFGILWNQRRDQGQFRVVEHDFWTSAYPFNDMQRIAPELYNDLTSAHLVIFKGDLNYRKLMGDLHWPIDTPLEKALRGFEPAPMVALRTLKCDVIVGITEKSAKAASDDQANWKFSSDYAVIQYHAKKVY